MHHAEFDPGCKAAAVRKKRIAGRCLFFENAHKQAASETTALLLILASGFRDRQSGGISLNIV